jgi:PAS domain S-box-containing protein
VLSGILGDWRAVRRWFAVRPILSKISRARDIDRLDGYRQALEDHFCITVTDCSGCLIEVNKRFCEVIGYLEAELLGRPYEMLSSGQHAPESLEEMWRIVHAGKTWRGEFCDRSKSGADVWFESIVIPRLNREGSIEQFITISTDIAPIRQKAQTLQAMIDNFSGGIALVNRDGRLVSNRLYRTLLDLPEELFADSHPKLETLVRFRAERGDYGTALPVEEAIAHRLETLLSPVPVIQERNENTGKVLEISCIPIPGDHHLNLYVDITERRRAELELMRAHSTLTAFIKHAPAAVAMFDTQMRYVAHSDRWLHDYKLTEESLVGRHHYDVFPEIPPHWRAKHLRILAGATESSPEEEFKRADGSTNIIRWEVRPWHLDDGSIGGIMMLTEEITERKKLEHQLWRLAKLDSLTGLPNRLQFNENLQALLASAGAAGRRFACWPDRCRSLQGDERYPRPRGGR